MLILHTDWQEEPDASEIFEILKKRITYKQGVFLPKNAEMLIGYEKSEKIYQLFADDEGGVGIFCDSTNEDYTDSIQDTAYRWDAGSAYSDF